ncbi:MAG: ArsS family sensor histidine kinase, partial [Campylobacterota bacterium]|nr:ArsS family sensor histidine kinase [Campylobacterota bacterium]
MNSHSLLVKISLFFLFVMGVINGLFYLQVESQQKQLEQSYMRKFHEARRVLHHARREFFDFEQTQEHLNSILGLKLLHELDSSQMEPIFSHKELNVYSEGSSTYLVGGHRGHKLIFVYQEQKDTWMSIGIFTLLINGVLLLFYLYLLYRLKPLGVLQDKIIAFAEGKMEQMPPIKGKDEIATLSHEFNQSMHKIKNLQDSRTLFLRNIMHELNTPIAKGKLICDLMEDTKNQERLHKIFNRFEYLLGEFRKIELATSNAMPLNLKPYRVVDILDNALDLLLIEPQALSLEIHDEVELEVDYELFSIVLKNLIDNALKYSKTKPIFTIESQKITIASQGEEIKDINVDT